MRKRRSAARQPKKINFNVDPTHFLNRDISWLHFNRRVLAEAADKRNPLLERLRFLIIFSSNLDEFVMKRVGYLKHQISSGFTHRSVDGQTAEEQLANIRRHINEDLERQRGIYVGLVGELQRHDIYIYDFDDLGTEDQDYLNGYFRRKMFPVLTPLSVDPGHPFPFISNLSYSLGMILRNPQTETVLFSRVKIPEVIPGLIQLPRQEGDKKFRFVTTVTLVRSNLHMLYPGMEIQQTVPFRVSRNADVDHREDEAQDLLILVEEGIKERRLADCVRLEIHKDTDPSMTSFLKDSLEIVDEDIYLMDFPIDFMILKSIVDLDLPELKFKPWAPIIPKAFFENNNFFSLIRQGDVLLHHPYESFSGTVEKFIANAADDPNVLTIKMTLYRTGDNSPFIRSLIKAAEKGKQVVCLVELKARFDEQRNIVWAQKLEDAGVHVVYGVLGLKTHTKTALIIRQEHDGEIMSYAHIGTGNYHSQTSNLYTDLGLLTCNKKICDEVVEVFNYLTGSSLKTDYQEILVAPINMKSTFMNKIQQEIKNKKAGKPARIIAKMNSMEDEVITEALYEASQMGVDITLIVRGFCCLRPGQPGLSDNIKVISIIGRFLEHSRVFYFANGSENYQDGEFFIGSADWMHRNLHNRVELIAPIYESRLKDKLWEFVDIMLNDNRQAWILNPDGTYSQKTPQDGEDERGTHTLLMNKTIQREKALT
ncbi:polyphosphate kinase 1 [Peredibacter starrii]|uniref:Polyphosphate kinase n=1 Tax=Peredibacter starrii TaxID=28202 RepID=A0AAX4HLP7_9BACT|nr:polyphosphate kinase 1 [Peredibacter starrii]WPU64184.1 polyphosphate kinase 1 [Peredibacter starrii]